MFAALPLAWKIVAPLGAGLAIVGGYLAWQYHQQSIGREMERAEYLEALMRQQQEAIGYHIVGAAMKLHSVERAMASKDRFHARMREPKPEAVSHESLPEVPDSQECVVSPRIVRDVNRWARVLNDTAAERAAAASGADPALPGAGSTPGAPGTSDTQ